MSKHLLKFILTIALLSVIVPSHVFALQSTSNVITPFNDVSDSDPNAIHISNLYYQKIVDGTGEGVFSPEATLTREQFAKFVVLAFKLPLSQQNDSPFLDLENEWSIPYVATAFKSNLINGTSAETFNPTATLTREEAASIVWRWVTYKINDVQNLSITQDVSDASEWAREAVNGIMTLGLRTEGKVPNPYQSKREMTRGDAAALIDLTTRYLDYGYRSGQPTLFVPTSNVVDLKNTSYSISPIENKLVIPRTTQTDILKVGDVITFSPNDEYPLGLAKKITDIQQQANGLSLLVVDPTFAEIVEKLDISQVIDLSQSSIFIPSDAFSQPENIAWNGKGNVQILAASTSEKSNSSKSKSKLTITTEKQKLKIALKDVKYNDILIEGEVALTNPSLIVDYQWENLRLKKYHLELSAKHTGSISIKNDKFQSPKPFKYELGKFVVPIPNTPLGVSFKLEVVCKIDGSISFVISESGYMDVGVSNQGGIGNFSATSQINPAAGVELKLSGSLSLGMTLNPSIFQITTDIFGIEESLIGIKATYQDRLNMETKCYEFTSKMYSEASAKVKVKTGLMEINEDFKLYNYEKDILNSNTCSQNTSASNANKPEDPNSPSVSADVTSMDNSIFFLPYSITPDFFSVLQDSFATHEDKFQIIDNENHGMAVLLKPASSPEGLRGWRYDEFNSSGQISFTLDGKYKEVVLFAQADVQDMKMRALDENGKILKTDEYSWSGKLNKNSIKKTIIPVEGVKKLTIQAASKTKDCGWLWISGKSFLE